jgi:peptidoglycan/xylan/chitin deacetylase (PgdA/CDA1 family)
MKLNLVTSWDDGRKQDMRLADLLRKYDLPAIFYIPVQTRELATYQIQEIAKDFEIGGHTVSHAHLNLVSLEDAKVEIEVSKKWLEDLIGKEVTSFCYPRGRYNNDVKKLVKEAGFKEARTTKVLYVDSEDPFETRTSVHIYNRNEYGDDGWMRVAIDMMHKAKEEGGIFHVWGHSWEIDKYDWWNALEELFKIIRKELDEDRDMAV